MCGIVAVVPRLPSRGAPDLAELNDKASSALTQLDSVGSTPEAQRLEGIARELADVNDALRGVPGVRAILDAPGPAAELSATCARIADHIAKVEAGLDEGGVTASELEAVNAALVAIKDSQWAITRDRIPAAQAVSNLVGANGSTGALAIANAINIALDAVDRLEVRGRDSAGIHLLITGHGLDLSTETNGRRLADRSSDPLFRNGSVRQTADGALSIVYKAAAEIGELGDNVRAIRTAITEDDLLADALTSPDAQVMVLGHTRWASVGIISEANAHPLNSDEVTSASTCDLPYAVGALNGDVDNYADIKVARRLSVRPEITTDAKVIPTALSHEMAAGGPVSDAFRRAIFDMEGSVAIAAQVAAEPDKMLLALRGSGQALYVGLADDAYVVASELYGIVEQTDRYIRLDGEGLSNPENPASRGQYMVLERADAGTLQGVSRFSYDGTELPVAEGDVHGAGITTRDIDRGDSPHFLLKEISEAPSSMRRTLRGKIVDRDGRYEVRLPEMTLTGAVRDRIKSCNTIYVIGQGTASVAGRAVAGALDEAFGGTDIRVRHVIATELSGFHIRQDMSDSLVVAISQSGTTTDTNRTVDLVRARGAVVVGIVNRRNSDLVEKSDGVLYTSDGRDVEMSVASTKAFYAQIAAGFLLALGLAAESGRVESSGLPEAQHRLLVALRQLPDAMTAVLGQRAHIAEVARRYAPPRRSWAVVGNGPNNVAAEELRIKLSELCYKAIACDVTEDKKHIDLSSEPFILVCAAGLRGSTASDVSKEVSIFRAHKAAPVVIATDGADDFVDALDTIKVPDVDQRLGFVLSAMAGHLFGYEAALAIDAQANPLRNARSVIEHIVTIGATGEEALTQLAHGLRPHADAFFVSLARGEMDGQLEASTAVSVASLFRYALGELPVSAYEAAFGRVGSPANLASDLNGALSDAIDQLTRPVDAIKHQAKTVTVGISRLDETLMDSRLVQAVFDAGAGRDSLNYQVLKTLSALDAAVESVTGFTRYRLYGDDGNPMLQVVSKGGIAESIPSRVESDPTLRGTKRTAAEVPRVLVAQGRRDGRTVIMVPEGHRGRSDGLTLLHVRLVDDLDERTARTVLEGYAHRYTDLRDLVTETEPSFDDRVLERISVLDLLTESVQNLAELWRA
ncbi:MAG: SIS domain-containing protein [Acidimicrobiia bacterium]|nr:SIS domain-containing protein [Acidimicrobiia bacterium]